MTLNQLRRALYSGARLLGDVNAVRRGRVVHRVVRKKVYSTVFRLLRKVFS